MPRFKKKARGARGRAYRHGFRSGLEHRNAERIESAGLVVKYEDPSSRIEFEEPPKKRRYTPDFVLPNGIIIETKGQLTLADRKKHLWIAEQHPSLDIRFVFSNSRNKIYKGSPTTYADWCEKHGFRYAEELIPEEWLWEPPSNTTTKDN